MAGRLVSGFREETLGSYSFGVDFFTVEQSNGNISTRIKY